MLSVVKRLSLLGLALALLTGCLSGGSSAPVVPSSMPDVPTETPPEPGAPATIAPTVNPDFQLIFRTFQHASNVFSVSLPENWRTRDDSTEERLLVGLEPPLGFASRVTVDVTYESDLSLDDLAALIDGYLELFYASNPNYTEINRANLPDGRVQVTYLYNEPTGASGREVVYLEQEGPYFSALRVFVADSDNVILTNAIDQLVESYTLNPTARWGEPAIAEITPDDLAVVGLNGLVDAQGNYWVMGRLQNNWDQDMEALAVSAGVCDPNGVVIAERASLLVSDVLPTGGQVPFAVDFGFIEGFTDDLRPCLVEPVAEPAGTLAAQSYNQFTVTHNAAFDPEADNPALVINGTLQNAGTNVTTLIDVIIAVYDAPDGNVIGYAVTSADESQLAPGQASFFIYAFDLNDLAAPPETFNNWVYEIWVQGNSPASPTQ